MSSKRMTANPVKPARYRPGKPVAEEHSSDEDDSQDEESPHQPLQAPPPKASSFPADTNKIATSLSKVDLAERRRLAAAEEADRVQAETLARAAEEEGFVTEESDEDESSSERSIEEATSGSEETSSEDEAPKKILRPTFIRKDQRKDPISISDTRNQDQLWADEEARRKEKADAMIQEQLEKDAAARAIGKKDWDDDDLEDVELVDDTDGLDPETERAAWKLRELKRVKRDREAIELAEQEREEIERRRNLSKEDREIEDREFLEQQKEEREDKGKMGYMQKYFHKGAFFQDDAKAAGLDRRDIMGSQFQDSGNREILPQYMQIRDMTKLGRKGATKYKDLKSEDTGRWGQFDRPGGKDRGYGVDNIFKPDGVGAQGASGANTTRVAERRRGSEAMPEGPHRADSAEIRSHERKTYRSYSRSRSGPRRRNCSTSSPRSPSHNLQERRRRSSTRSSVSPKRSSHQVDTGSRKRSRSLAREHIGLDKRQRIEMR